MTLAVRADGAAFADVVYADQDWVDAEFAALVAASLGGPPTPTPPASAQIPHRPGTPPLRSSRRPGSDPAVRLFPRPGPARGRQRSPPAPPAGLLGR